MFVTSQGPLPCGTLLTSSIQLALGARETTKHALANLCVLSDGTIHESRARASFGVVISL